MYIVTLLWYKMPLCAWKINNKNNKAPLTISLDGISNIVIAAMLLVSSTFY